MKLYIIKDGVNPETTRLSKQGKLATDSKKYNDSRFRDEASSTTTINALIEDEKSATEAYNVAISNLKDKLDAKAIQVLTNIRNDERRHIENLYSILNGNITEKNLEDSKEKR